MSKEKASLMSEATLWQLYRRLLAEELLRQRVAETRLSGALRMVERSGAVAAALTANLREEDTLGLAPHDLTTRYLRGVPLEALHEQVQAGVRGRRSASSAKGYALAADVEHGLLPGVDAEQASLAVGTALAARLHQTEALTVLLASAPKDLQQQPEADKVRHRDHTGAAGLHLPAHLPVPCWVSAVESAVSLGLPLLFISESSAPPPQPAADPRGASTALPVILVDRRDAIALYRVIYESAVRARARGGPTWIHCCDPIVQERPRRGEMHAERSAAAMMEESLRARNVFHRDQQRQMQRAVEKEFSQTGWGPHS